jgi:hypothetical protein
MNRTLAVLTRMFASAAAAGPGGLAASAAFAATAPQPTMGLPASMPAPTASTAVPPVHAMAA